MEKLYQHTFVINGQKKLSSTTQVFQWTSSTCIRGVYVVKCSGSTTSGVSHCHYVTKGCHLGFSSILFFSPRKTEIQKHSPKKRGYFDDCNYRATRTRTAAFLHIVHVDKRILNMPEQNLYFHTSVFCFSSEETKQSIGYGLFASWINHSNRFFPPNQYSFH